MNYNFDEIIERSNTASVKYDLRKSLFGKEDIIPMWVADMDFKTPDFIIDAIHERLEHPVLGYTLKPLGLDDAVVEWLKRWHRWDIRKGWIVPGPAVIPSMVVMVHAFTDPGDEIIVQQPVYYPFFRTITGNGRRMINNPLVPHQDKYRMDLDDLKRKISAKTKMIFLCSPHNPVGRVWDRQELEDITSICLENNILIVSDEIHADLLLYGNRHLPTASLSEEVAHRTITCMSSSKTFNTAGLNSAYVIIPDLRLRTAYKEKLNDFHLNLGSVTGYAALESGYRQGDDWLIQMLKYVEGNIDYLQDYLVQHLPSVKMYKPQGTYLVWLDFRNTSLHPDKLQDFLVNEVGIGLSNGALFGEEGVGFQRMNVACPRSLLRKGLENLAQALNN